MSDSSSRFIRESELRTLLLDSKFDEFNERAQHEPPNLEKVALRGLDLREADLSHANLRGAYLRNADLRGCDMFYADLEGASIHQAHVSGVRFPPNLTPDEINLSLIHGTRLRTQRTASTPSNPPSDPEES